MHPALAQFRRPGVTASPRCAGDLCQEFPAVDAADSNSLAMEIFYARRDMGSLAVVEGDRPIGLINRDIFLSQMSKPFHRELYDKKSCIAFMDKEPLIVDADMSIEALTFKTVEAGNKALSDGFIVTRQGRFVGLASGFQLLGAVAEVQAEKNRQIMQSIEYASVIQQAMLRASRDALSSMLADAALVWEPRDVVGGDFYHFASFPDGWFCAVADCTGHGVPGAFMTLLASASLSQALERIGPRDPAALLAAVNRNVKGPARPGTWGGRVAAVERRPRCRVLLVRCAIAATAFFRRTHCVACFAAGCGGVRQHGWRTDGRGLRGQSGGLRVGAAHR